MGDFSVNIQSEITAAVGTQQNSRSEFRLHPADYSTTSGKMERL
jgi:hypothetical protein